MANDPLEPVRLAEAEIQKRAQSRDASQLDFRGPIAAELIADEMTRVAAELKVMRGLLATIAAKLR
jgi:hypothetical protein